MGGRGSIGAHHMSGRGSTSAHTATDRVRGNVPVVIGRGSSNLSVGMRHRIPDDAEPQQEQPYVHDTSTTHNEQHCSSDGLPQELQDLCVDGDGSSIPGGAQFSNMPESSHAAERRAAGIEDWQFYGFQSEAEYLVWQNDKRRYVKVVGNGWDPYNTVKGVTRALHAGYVEPWLTYKHVPSDTKKLWFEYFRREYKWLPIDEAEVWRKFESTTRRRISDLTNKGRTRTKKPDFIPLDIWNEMLEQWQRPEWQEISKRNSANRKANSSIHHLGSIPTHEAARRMEKELGRKVTYAEVFKKAHRKGTDGPYIDSRAEQTMARYDEMLHMARNASESDSNSTPVDENAVFLQAIGPPRKGRLYGVGSQVSVESVSNTTSHPRRVMTKEQLAAAVTRAIENLNETVRSHCQRIESQDNLIIQLQQQITKQNKMLEILYAKVYGQSEDGESSSSHSGEDRE